MDYVDMLAHVLPKVRGCPESLAAMAMREASIEWCRDTYALTTGITGMSAAGASALTFEEEVVIAILDARIDGQTIKVVHANSDELVEASETNRMLVYGDPQLPLLVPAPTAATEVELLVVLVPGPASLDIPDDLWRRDHQALTWGCLKYLYEDPGNPWTDGDRAIFYAGKFNAEKVRAAAMYGRNRENKAQRLRVRPAL